MKSSTIIKIFWVAGAFNIGGVLLFSIFFTNPHIAKYYPSVFSNFGLIVIILWGLAYIAAAPLYTGARALMGVFTVEKLVYFITWVLFLIRQGASLPEIFNESIMTGAFYALYGPGDLAFGCFFAWVGLKGYGTAPRPINPGGRS